VVSTDSIDFGTVGIGTGTYTKLLSVKNISNFALAVSVNATGLPTPPFKASGASSFTLRPNGSSTIPVTFTPTQPGAPQGTMIVSARDGESATVSVKGVAEGPVLVAPTTLDFGTLKVGQSKTMTLRIGNSGLTVLTGSFETSNLVAPFAAVLSAGGKFRIVHGASYSAIIRFAPRATGPFSGTITIVSNDPSNPSVTVTVQGSGG
jgi:hypothetical protein